MSGGAALAQRVTFGIDPVSDGKTFSITPDGEGVRVTGSDAYMLLAGAYHLLDHLGCRFLAPEFAHYRGAAEVVPQLAPQRIALDAPVTRRPRLKFRKLYVEEGISHDFDNLKQLVEWMPKAGYNVLVIPTDYGGRGRVKWDNWREALTPELEKRGITIEVGGHGYENFINAQMEGGALFDRHPQWFGADEKGVRQKSKKFVFCTSNPAAGAFVIDNVIAYLKDRPEIKIFDFWPPDGARWCACDECQKLGEPQDRQAVLLRQVHQKLAPVRPDVRLEIIAYSSYLQPPKRVAIDPNVLVDFCPISQHFDAPIFDASDKNKVYADALGSWRRQFAGDLSIYSYYRKYAWDSLPVVIPHYMQRDLKWYAELPVQGVSVYSEPGDWFTYELNHWMLAQLAWDVDANVDALMTEFCRARYGEAAEVARDALLLLQDTVRIYGSVPHVPLKDADGIAKARTKVRTRLAGVQDASGRTEDAATRHSLERLALMCTYAERDLEIQFLRATAAPREEIVAKASALHAWVREHADEGVFLIKGHRLTQGRMLTRYGVGGPRRSSSPVAAPE